MCSCSVCVIHNRDAVCLLFSEQCAPTDCAVLVGTRLCVCVCVCSDMTVRPDDVCLSRAHDPDYERWAHRFSVEREAKAAMDAEAAEMEGDGK